MTTSDGYILALHRVPSGHPDGPHPKGGGVPVLLGHCLIGSSAIFSWGPANTSMAYVFADRGESSLSPKIKVRHEHPDNRPFLTKQVSTCGW